MEVVPVIDLKGGQVVHARQGQREAYRPMVSLLSSSSAPADIVAGLLGLFAFSKLYVADLDAIAGTGDHAEVLAAIGAAWPGVELWVDRGTGDLPAARAWLDRGLGSLVLGSESQRDVQTVRVLAAAARVLVSLDFRDEVFQGPPALLDDPSIWAARVIVMTLSRVGAGGGPDLDRLRSVMRRAEGRQVYAAGGVRDAQDLLALQAEGAAGVLVATALHTGAITPADLATVMPTAASAR